MSEISEMPESDQLLVFICAANACRSAIAEVIATDEAQRRGLAVRVASAGTHALPGYRAATIAQLTMEEVGLSLHEHRSQPASAELIAEAALVVTMTDVQRDMLRTAFKDDKDKIVSFDDVTHEGDVFDPIGGDPQEVRAVRERLQAAMPQIFGLLERRAGGVS